MSFLFSWCLLACQRPVVSVAAESGAAPSSLTSSGSRISSDSCAAAGAMASWITVPAFRDSSLANSWLVFARELEVSKIPEEVPTAIAADTKYWLWVNDSLIVREGGLKWGPIPDGYYVDEMDLAPYLKSGTNTIKVLTWYFGKAGFSHKSSGKAGLWFDAPTLGLVSDATWQSGIHGAFMRETGKPYPNYRLPESNVGFRAAAAAPLTSHATPLYGYTGSWNPAITFSREERPFPRTIPQWKDFGLRPYRNAPDFPFVSDGKPLRLQLPYNAQVTAALTISAPAAAHESDEMRDPDDVRELGAAPGSKALDTIDIRTDNYRGGGPPNLRTIYLPTPGRQTFESPGWFNGHEVIYTIPAGITVHDLAFRESGFAAEFTGAFTCDDPFYDKLWEKARRTLYVTMRDNYMDCPDRERAQWWGDVVLEAGETSYALDRNSDLLTAKAIRELMDWQRADSTIYSPVPAGNWNGELPTQMLASVGRFGIWNYYLHSGDRATLEHVYPAVKRYLHLWQTDERGLVIRRKGGWTWGDWGDQKDMPLIFDGWYHLALDGFARMAETLGHTADARWARDKMTAHRDAFNEVYWTGNAYRSPDNPNATDDRGQALAVLAGIAPKAYYPALREVFATQEFASPYFEKYVEEALFEMGYSADALKRMKKRFRLMVDSPLTTLWEGWEIGSAKYGGGTNNHAWSGGGLTLLSQYVAGVEPLEPGYRTVRIRPQLGVLNYANASVDTPLGLLRVRVRRVGGETKVEYDAPEGMKVVIEK